MTAVGDRGPARVAFGLLVVGVLIQLGAVVWGGAVYPGYDHARQYISELGATGAVTGPAVSWWGFVPSGLFVIAFCLTAGWLLRRSRMAVAVCLLLAWYGVGLSAAGVYPCAFECARTDTSANAMLHDLFGGTGYLAGIIGVAMAGLWARSRPAAWLAPAAAVCLALCIAGFWGMIVEFELGGLLQRGLEGSVAVFLLLFGRALMKGQLAAAPVEP